MKKAAYPTTPLPRPTLRSGNWSAIMSAARKAAVLQKRLSASMSTTVSADIPKGQKERLVPMFMMKAAAIWLRKNLCRTVEKASLF